MKCPQLQHLYYHRDYDGVVAAAMIMICSPTEPELVPVQYSSDLGWIGRDLGSGAGIVDFLYHPEAVLWIDHHATTFSSDAMKRSFRADAFHIFAPNAASCPGVIVRQPWFCGGAHWEDYVRWADIIDGAAFESPTQANDLTNPHILLSHIINEIASQDILAEVVREVTRNTAADVLTLSCLHAIRTRVLRDDLKIRKRLSKLLRVQGRVAILDQSELSMPYRRYLAYELYPETRYGIGLYRSGNTIIVSVGENPWNEAGPLHLGELCREFGGGGRRATAGVPTSSAVTARELATILAARLNEALRVHESPVTAGHA